MNRLSAEAAAGEPNFMHCLPLQQDVSRKAVHEAASAHDCAPQILPRLPFFRGNRQFACQLIAD